MITFTRAPLCTRHGNQSWSRPLESMLVLGLYQATSTFLNRLRSGSPRCLYSDLLCHKDCQNAIYYLNFLKKKKKKTVFVRYTCVPNRKTRTEMVQYEYVYRYTPNIYIYIYVFDVYNSCLWTGCRWWWPWQKICCALQLRTAESPSSALKEVGCCSVPSSHWVWIV